MTVCVTYTDRRGAAWYGPLPLPAGCVATGLARVLVRLAAEGCTDVRVWETVGEYRAWYGNRAKGTTGCSGCNRDNERADR